MKKNRAFSSLSRPGDYSLAAMKGSLRLLLLAGWLCCHTSAAGQDTNFWIFLCFGQSNMEGYPGLEEQDKSGVDPRFQMFAAVDFPKQERQKGHWYPAVPPLCRPGNGIGPAD